VRSRRGVLNLAILPVVLDCLGALMLPTSETLAACAPATGDNITVTCSGTTTDQGPGSNTGYGASNQNGVTVNVQSGASVLGTSIGIDLNNNNIVNNLGTITTVGTPVLGNVYGINANGPLTVTNSGTIGRTDLVIPGNNDTAGINASGDLFVTNTGTGVIQGSTAILAPGTPNTMTVLNAGLISGLVGGGGTGIFGDTVTVTNNASGTITGDVAGIQANTATIYNYGTISSPGLGGTGVSVNLLTLVNYASGLITGDGFGISGTSTPIQGITNFGTISATGSGSTAILINRGSITNNVGASSSGTVPRSPGRAAPPFSMPAPLPA
jgi:hypothetical protein